MLAQPEGVPDDLADFGQSSDGDATEADDAVETTALGPASAAEPSAEGSSTEESQEPHQSYAQMLVKHDYFPREDGEEDEAAKDGTDVSETGSESDETENSAKPDQTDATTSQTGQTATEDARQSRNLPKLPHRKSPSGLSVSGTVRFSPPPNSSPTFDGKPRLIRGYIARQSSRHNMTEARNTPSP